MEGPEVSQTNNVAGATKVKKRTFKWISNCISNNGCFMCVTAFRVTSFDSIFVYVHQTSAFNVLFSIILKREKKEVKAIQLHSVKVQKKSTCFFQKT